MKDEIKDIIAFVLQYLDMDSEDARALVYRTGMAETGYRKLRYNYKLHQTKMNAV